MYFGFDYGDFKKMYIFPIGYNLPELYVLKRCTLKLKYERIKKSIFSIDNAKFSQLILLDKLVNGQGL
jgi:hypothetical protein